MLACWCIVFEQGTGLDVLDAERVPGLQVLIGNVSCVITAIQSSYLSVIAPAEPSVINEDGNENITGYPYGPDFNVVG